MSYWRDRARSGIAEALRQAEARGLEGKARERFVSEAYPFGERANHPYKIWCDEFALQVKGIDRHKTPSPGRDDLPGQGSLFD